MDSSDREIAKRIRVAREAAGFSQTDFAAKLGLSKQGYNHYEKGVSPFTVQQLFQASHVLNRSVEYFLGLDTGLGPDEDRALTLYREAAEKGLGDLALSMLVAIAGTPRQG